MGAQPMRVFVSHTSELAAFPEKRSYVEAACAAVRRAEVLGCDVYLDGTLLATASHDHIVRIWHVATRRCRCALRVASPLFRIAWHPEGTSLCAVGGAGTYLLAYRR